MSLNRKILIEIAVAISIVFAVAVLGFVGYKYYFEKDKQSTNEEAPKLAKCEDLELLTPDNTPAPVSHVLSSKLNENSDSDADICTWNVNGELSHTSFPVGGKCLFGDQIFDKAGVYKIELVVEKNQCKISKEVVVN